MIEIIRTVNDLKSRVDQFRSRGLKIGFVPTMGALHQGHLSLIKRAKQENDVVVCSIFVNPTQFNDKKDLELYPRPIELDIDKLNSENCDVLFLPEVDEIYPKNDEAWFFDLGYLDEILEGACRPGHYQGVTQIVKKLFDFVNPNNAYFGQKDYQQVMVIRELVKRYSMPINLICCETEREQDGLAMSSRNIRLSDADRIKSLALSKALFYIKDNKSKDVDVVMKEALGIIESNDIDVEYLYLADAGSLKQKESFENAVVLVAAKVGSVRLIDNILI